jgi:hypothetical protein
MAAGSGIHEQLELAIVADRVRVTLPAPLYDI